MKTKQPVWKFVCSIGDVNPLEEQTRIYVDETGVYEPEAETIRSIGKDFFVYCYSLPKCTHINSALSDNKYHPDKEVWFADRLQDLADFIGVQKEDLINSFVSDNLLERAQAWETIGDYFGFDELDEYPTRLTEGEILEKYK